MKDKLELIHSHQHTPVECKHNARQQYSDGLLRLDENYNDNLKEGNGPLDLSNLDKIIIQIYLLVIQMINLLFLVQMIYQRALEF